MKLEIITRCTRTENLLRIRDSIFTGGTDWCITWRIIFDSSVLGNVDPSLLSDMENPNVKFHFMKGIPGDMGHSSINTILDSLTDSWVYVLDDDNILHENFLKETYELLKDQVCTGLIFSQFVGGKDFSGLEVRQAFPENVCVGKIDMAQFILHTTLIDEERLQPNTYVADGIFIEKLYKKHTGKFLIVDRILSYYNHLKRDSQPYSLPRILVSGKEINELKSWKAADYESDNLYLSNPPASNILDSIVKDDPDCFITIGDKFSDFPQLCNLSYDFRRRWIHVEQEQNLGEIAYQCAMSSILNPDVSKLVSIFTPVYNTKEKLHRTYTSIQRQTYSNWEWVIVNDSSDTLTGKIAKEIAQMDPRVKVYEIKERTKGIIGESKYRACVLSRGNYLLELDHDDYLLPDALELLVDAFQKNPEAGFVYSDCAEIDENFNSLTYGEGFAMGYGAYREEIHFNRNFKVAIAPNVNPLTIRHIVGVPNHFRSWKREAYFKAGCHNRRLSIADDYELFIRTFLTTEIVKIQRCCYLQFMHNSNSQDISRADIQRRVRTISFFYNQKIKERFEELGQFDWAYSTTQHFLGIPPRFGNDEGHVNKIHTI